MKKHKTTLNEPDDFIENSAFNKLMYDKTQKIRGVKDQIATFKSDNAKVRNSIEHYIEMKGPLKWYIGIQVKLYKGDGEERQEVVQDLYLIQK